MAGRFWLLFFLLDIVLCVTLGPGSGLKFPDNIGGDASCIFELFRSKGDGGDNRVATPSVPFTDGGKVVCPRVLCPGVRTDRNF